MTDDAVPQYYFNTRTGAVEVGKPSSWENRMGPYPTRAAAEEALRLASARTDAWDEEDRRERERDA